MPIVKFEDIEIDNIYVTRGGIAVLDKSGKTTGWGYDRVKVIKKDTTKVVVQTPWGTECVLNSKYPLFKTGETETRCEFKLVTTYISKQEISFDEALARGICTEDASIEVSGGVSSETAYTDKVLRELVKYFSKPRSMGDAAKKFGRSYQNIRYLVEKIENGNLYLVLRDKDDTGKIIVQIVKVENK